MAEWGSKLTSSEYLENFFFSHRMEILTSAQASNMDDLIFDKDQAVRATEISRRILHRLTNNPTTRTLDYLVLSMTAHMSGVMSARPLTCRHASASFVDFTNVVFAAGSAFALLGLGSLSQIDSTIRRRFLLNFQDRASRQEPLEYSIGPDLERDLSTILFFFEAYIRSGFLVEYKFRNPRRSHRFR